MALIGFIIGAILGSFCLALAQRSLENKSFFTRSHCQVCKKKLVFYDLIPIISYILLKGKCRYCKRKIGLEYLIAEIALGFLIGFLFWQSFNNSQFSILSVGRQIFNFNFLIFQIDLLIKVFFITILSILFITDYKDMFIPNRVIIPSIIIGTASLFLIAILKIIYIYYSLSAGGIGKFLLPPYSDYFLRHARIEFLDFGSSLLTGFLIGGFFWFLILITKGKGMGGGDVKLGAFIGLILGFPKGLLAIILSFITGALFSLILIFFGKKKFGQVIPFGPFLVLGSLIALYFGDFMITWYLGLGY